MLLAGRVSAQGSSDENRDAFMFTLSAVSYLE